MQKLGHHVFFTEDTQFAPYPKVHINLFLQPSNIHYRPFLAFAERNYLIPNHEWSYFSPEEIAFFDTILCKTKEAERIFKPMNTNTIFMGFSCKDSYEGNIPKNYKMPLHLAGASLQKGTNGLVRMWLNNPQFPSLTIIKHKEKVCYPPASNLNLIFDYLPISRLRSYQNSCGLHLCPSETEGFGHYIMEGMSCEAVIVTTDAPPMNEFISDKRCLVGYNRTAPLNLATNYYVDPVKLELVVANLLKLSEEELKEIGKKNREFYLENDRLFKNRLAEIFRADFKLMPKQAKEDYIEKVFTSIYQAKAWAENPSGEGSTPENTRLYRFFLQNFLKDHSIKNVVDLGSGDWGFSCLIDWTGIQYTGYDICKEMIERNQAQFGSKTINFIYGNGLRENLPKADLLICKDVLQHLPLDEIMILLPQLPKFKYALLINDVDPITLTTENIDVPAGSYRFIDLTKPPFHLSGQKVLTFISGGVTKQILLIKNQ